MSSHELAVALAQAVDTERLARAQFERSQADPPERDTALRALRLVIPLRRTLEGWIAERACRAVSQT